MRKAQTHDVMIAGAEMKDAAAARVLRFKVVKEMQVARALRLIQRPGAVPEVELVHGEDSPVIDGRRPGVSRGRNSPRTRVVVTAARQ